MLINFNENVSEKPMEKLPTAPEKFGKINYAYYAKPNP